MDHAEARNRLMDLVLEPARLRGLDRDEGPESSELLAHISTCPECGAELGSWRGTYSALDKAVRAGASDATDPAATLRDLAATAGLVALPPGLRARALAMAEPPTALPVRTIAAPRRFRRLPAFLAAAAAIVLVVGASAVVVDFNGQLSRANAEVASLGAVTSGMDLVLQDPGHKVAQLLTPDGKPAGSLAWSTARGEIVVLAHALAGPPAGQVYRCRVQQDGSAVVVGEMRFSGSLAYWAGPMDSWTPSFSPGSRFIVSLESSAGNSPGTQVLSATL
jgi:hypothetical protein